MASRPGNAGLATPLSPPWTERRYRLADPDDPRDAFSRDRDRLVHSRAFRLLQHKTQVYIIHEGDFYRTRLTHTLEVAQIARTTARELGLNEPLAEAIALGHDLGHTPFGHAGEAVLDRLLREAGEPAGWDSNRHSLTVVDQLERAYPDHPGLNLTFATRQGIARHQTRFDRPVEGFDPYPQPTPEAQVVNLADFLAYATHDVQDALEIGLLTPEQLREAPAMEVWQEAWERAEGEVREAVGPAGMERGERVRLEAVRARRHLIDRAIRDIWQTSRAALEAAGVTDHAGIVGWYQPLIRMSEGLRAAFERAVDYLFKEVYGHPLVRRQNFRGAHLMEAVFRALLERPDLLPRARPPAGAEAGAAGGATAGSPAAARAREVAYYLASLTDRGLVDLYTELFDPRERVLGHLPG